MEPDPIVNEIVVTGDTKYLTAIMERLQSAASPIGNADGWAFSVCAIVGDREFSHAIWASDSTFHIAHTEGCRSVLRMDFNTMHSPALMFMQQVVDAFRDCVLSWRMKHPSYTEFFSWDDGTLMSVVSTLEDFENRGCGTWSVAEHWSNGWWTVDGERMSPSKVMTLFADAEDSRLRLFAAEHRETPIRVITRLREDPDLSVALAARDNKKYVPR